MNLSKSALEVLKNFSSINQGLLFKKGNVIRTMSVRRNVFGRAVVPDAIPRDFAVYDLPEFLSTISLLDNPEFAFDDKSMTIKDAKDNKIKYFYSSPSVIVAPPDKEMKLPATDISFKMTASQLEQIQKASAVMRLKELDISKSGVRIFNSENPGNEFMTDIGVVAEEDAKAVLHVEELKFIPGDYQVEITTQGIARFLNTSCGFELEYFVTLASTN